MVLRLLGPVHHRNGNIWKQMNLLMPWTGIQLESKQEKEGPCITRLRQTEKQQNLTWTPGQQEQKLTWPLQSTELVGLHEGLLLRALCGPQGEPQVKGEEILQDDPLHYHQSSLDSLLWKRGVITTFDIFQQIKKSIANSNLNSSNSTWIPSEYCYISLFLGNQARESNASVEYGFYTKLRFKIHPHRFTYFFKKE